VCDEGLVSPQAHNGIHFQHTRDIKLCNAFDLQLIVVISTSQSTKHRVTLFRYVVTSLATPSASADIIVTSL
jgi:hypothetical protein